MDVVEGLKRIHGVARMRDLRKFGIDRAAIWTAIREHRVIRLRKGWVALPTISPVEARAVESHALLTCSAAASVRGLPSQGPHFHIRSRIPSESENRTTRRKTPTRQGACVGMIEMVIDYANCQPPEWTLALVDELERKKSLTRSDWSEIENAVRRETLRIITMRNSKAESALESVVRYRLSRAKIPYTMQVPIGRFRVDFIIGRGVIVETHGAEFHSDRSDWERDRRKVSWLRAQGWDVLEISYSQVLGEWDSVLKTLQTARSRQRNMQFPNLMDTK